MALSVHILLPLAAFFVSLHMAMRAARQRANPAALSFTVLMSALAVWSLTIVLEHASPGLSDKVLWLKLSYLGILSVPPAWLVLTLRYTLRERWLKKRNLVLLCVLPMVTLVMVWTNDAHHLMWTSIWLDTSFAPPVDGVTHGAWFWIQAGYSYLLVFLGTLVLVREFLKATGLHRKRVGIMLAGALAPWVANVLYIAPVRVFEVLDPTPLAFVVTGAVFSWGLFRLRFIDIMPVAYEAVFAQMSDGVVVLNSDGLIVELNPSAQAMLRLERSRAVGMPYAVALPALAGQLRFMSPCADTAFDVPLGEGDSLRHYTVTPSFIAGEAQFNGCLLLLHDDTVRMRNELETRERIRLEIELVERRRSEESLRASETKYRNLVRNAASGIIVSDVEGHILTTNRAALSIFGYATEQELIETPAMRLFVNEDDGRRLTEPLARTGVAKGFEARMRRKDGAAFWASLNVIIQTPQSGESQYLALVDDVSARKNVESELEQSRQDLRLLAQRVEQAREDERTSLARELHDQVGQTFTAIRMDLGRVRRRLDPDHHDAISLLDGLTRLVDAGTDDVRRISSELRPGALDDLGLAGAIEFYLEQTSSRSGIALAFTNDSASADLEPTRSTALFRVLQELVTNVVRHSGAKTANVSLESEGEDYILTVTDDGCGIDMREVSNAHSLGVIGMRERLLPYGGELHLRGEPGKGTTARVVLPLNRS